MEYFFIILAQFMIHLDSGAKAFKFLPNLPLGEYRVNIIATQLCNLNQKNSVLFNFSLYKTSRNTTDLRGNVTAYRTFDDSVYLRLSMAVKDKIGSWQSNAYVYNSPQGYSSLKKLFGAEFQIFLRRFGVNETIKDSIPPGIYTTKGYDISNYPTNTNFPKQIFYGTYKFKINYTEKNGEPVGCFLFTVEIKRPWEIE